MRVLLFSLSQHLFEDALAAHGIDQRYLQARHFNAAGEQVHAFRMMQDAFSWQNRFVHEDFSHERSKRHGQFIWLRITQTDGQAGLRIAVNQQHLFAFLCQSDAEIGCRGRFAGVM